MKSVWKEGFFDTLLKKFSFHSRVNVYFLWAKKSKWKLPLNISDNGFYKQVLDFHRPSKIFCRTSGRQNHWYLYSIFRRFINWWIPSISILCVYNSHIDNIKNLLSRITKYTSAVQKEHEMLRKRIIIEYRSFFVSENSMLYSKCRHRREGHHHNIIWVCTELFHKKYSHLQKTKI